MTFLNVDQLYHKSLTIDGDFKTILIFLIRDLPGTELSILTSKELAISPWDVDGSNRYHTNFHHFLCPYYHAHFIALFALLSSSKNKISTKNPNIPFFVLLFHH